MRGEYSTRQKRDMLRFLEERSMQHFSVDEVVFEMQERGERIGRSTVYRFLEQLSETGSVRKYQNAQGVTQYQHVENGDACDNHFHMMCSSCGNLLHVDCEHITGLCAHLMEEHGFMLDPRGTILVGLCADCREDGKGETHGTDRTDECHHCI